MPALRLEPVVKALRHRLDLVLLALVVAVLPFLSGASWGLAGLGVVTGSGLALQGLGLILVLRSSRIINFAQVQLGVISGIVFFELVRHSQFVLVAHMACGGCFTGLPTDFVYLQSHPLEVAVALARHGDVGWLVANFWVSVVVGVMLGPGVSWLVYRFVVRRFEAASRLIATVVTIALAEVLVGITTVIPGLFQDPKNQTPVAYAPLPNVQIRISGVLFHFGDVLTVGVVIVATAALALFLTRHRAGTAMRAVADNRSRALTLGMRVTQVGSVSWMLAGTLSAVAAVVGAMSIGEPGLNQAANAFDVATLVEILVAVVFARLVSLPIVVVASIALGILKAVLFQTFQADVPFDVGMFVLVGVGLLLQTSLFSRSANEEAAAIQLVARERRPIPPELRHVHAVDRGIRWMYVLLFVVVIGGPLLLAPEQVSQGTVILIDTIIGLSLLVLTGWAGQVSLGQFAFAALGGYVATLLGARFGVFFPASLLVGAIVGGAAAVLVGLPALRLRGLYLAVMTLALAFATNAIVLNPTYLGQFLPSSLDRPSILGLPLDDERAFFYVTLVFLLLTVAAVAGLRRSRIGRTLIACRDNEQAGQSFGISILRARLWAFAISGFLAAMAGGLLAYQQHGIEAPSFAPVQGLAIFLIVIIGGLGSVIGPLVGSIYFGIFTLFSIPALALLASGLGVIGVLMLYPSGVSGLVYAARDGWLRRVAVRLRIPVPSLFADGAANPLETAASIAPKMRPGGGTVFIPRRYELTDHWASVEDSARV